MKRNNPNFLFCYKIFRVCKALPLRKRCPTPLRTRHHCPSEFPSLLKGSGKQGKRQVGQAACVTVTPALPPFPTAVGPGPLIRHTPHLLESFQARTQTSEPCMRPQCPKSAPQTLPPQPRGHPRPLGALTCCFLLVGFQGIVSCQVKKYQ